MKEDLDFEIRFCEGIYKRDQEDTRVLEMLASFYTKVGRIDEGLALDLKHTKLEPENPSAHYNLACSLCLKNSLEDALSSLRKALEIGFNDFEWMMDDPDLENLHDDERFLSMVREFQKQTT